MLRRIERLDRCRVANATGRSVDDFPWIESGGATVCPIQAGSSQISSVHTIVVPRVGADEIHRATGRETDHEVDRRPVRLAPFRDNELVSLLETTSSR